MHYLTSCLERTVNVYLPVYVGVCGVANRSAGVQIGRSACLDTLYDCDCVTS